MAIAAIGSVVVLASAAVEARCRYMCRRRRRAHYDVYLSSDPAEASRGRLVERRLQPLKVWFLADAPTRGAQGQRLHLALADARSLCVLVTDGSLWRPSCLVEVTVAAMASQKTVLCELDGRLARGLGASVSSKLPKMLRASLAHNGVTLVAVQEVPFYLATPEGAKEKKVNERCSRLMQNSMPHRACRSTAAPTRQA